MSASATKRVVLYRWDRAPAEGVVDANSYLRADLLEWMTVEGKLQLDRLSDLKALCFLTESGPADLFTKDNLFERRPKTPGLWTRFTFRDEEKLDGILSANLLEWPRDGFLITPPKARLSRQRVFIPRLALRRTELRGVVGGPSRELVRRTAGSETELQIRMFD